MNTKQKEKTPMSSVQATSQVPPEARRSHWSARMRDLLEAHGGIKEVCLNYADRMTDSDQQLMRNRVNSILMGRSTVETSSLFVVALEELISLK